MYPGSPTIVILGTRSQVPQYNIATRHNLLNVPDPGPTSENTLHSWPARDAPLSSWTSQPMNGLHYRSTTSVAFPPRKLARHKLAQSLLHTSFERENVNEEVESIDRNFVQNIVKIFKDQRIRGYQFAVLILSPERQVTMKQAPFCIMTDKTSPTHPPNSTLRDFIVARPIRRKQHAEELLLERFDELLDRNASNCQSIVLYTWFVPCEGCTRKIIRMLGQFTETYCVTVVYSSKMNDMSEELEKRNTSKLEAAHITVIRKRYMKHLQSAGVRIKSHNTALTSTSPQSYDLGNCLLGADIDFSHFLSIIPPVLS